MRPRSLTASLIVAFLAAVPAGCGDEEGTTPVPRPSREAFGVNAHLLKEQAVTGQLGQVDAQLRAIEDLGLAFVRANLDWWRLERRKPEADGSHAYEFATFDPWVAALARHHLRWYPVLLGYPAPEWVPIPAHLAARCRTSVPPSDPGDFAAMTAAVTERYGRNGTFWDERRDLPYLPISDYEIWNEENSGSSWCPAPDPRAYASLYLASRTAIHGVDPRARVVIGGLAPYDRTLPPAQGSFAQTEVGAFLAALITAQPSLKTDTDVLGVHAYGTPEVVLGQLARYRAVADDVGLRDVPISLNETGWTTRGAGSFQPVPETTRADYLAEVTDSAIRSGCDVQSLAPHTWVSEESDPSDQAQWFGIADPLTGHPYRTALEYSEAASDLVAAGNGPLDGLGICKD